MATVKTIGYRLKVVGKPENAVSLNDQNPAFYRICHCPHFVHSGSD